ncbi:hypothetical protein FOPG_17868 [Fusarium oxysporum f. sp. conglutinans race 2 54008]|uniref:Aminoglycoside phosphotransferase domain-containing protein n=3 Tax=Fusarium oxysporum f. sp. conglutinans TaxID=100902 RepID=A0A8H6LBN4_FUSOX|nr:hypothetical protein FOPG_17868 [Fusarium oxysporum f. sp. conglutinans race 2 54008]EXL65932.1 hypothetical protein FOPG_17868 [Fusarium oxysporum f. sp. conglutinans race 2 54008]KAF6513211.1 hypothetical protein HZS61_007469 [Fusarium oxysporum f. sp. conglutinans]KAG7001696.1 hypothetical protein FocnCong_v011220 [Fusarium oxysporum f. sp. conglutinans]
MKDKIYYFAKFNLPALLSLSEQRRGQPCSCDVSQMPKSGSLNWVIFLSFEDGTEWVFRSPKSGLDCFYSDETASKILISEASTLLYLKAHTSIPVPEVYAYSGSSDNDIGIPYILQSKAPGRSLGSYDWTQLPQQVPGFQHRRPLMPISNENREKVMSQLGAMMSELSIHRFKKIGSLFDDGNGSYAVGECLSPSLTWQERDSLELDRGPFNQESDYFVSLISAFTSHAQELSLTPHTFFAPVPDMLDYKSIASYQAASRRWNNFVAIGQKIEHSKNILFYCIAGQFLSEMIPHLSSSVRNSFTLSHPDLHLGNIYVDEDFNITCIIDWSSVSTGPVSELLAAPSLGSSAAPPSKRLTAAYRSGFSQRATEITPDLPYSDLWQTSERMWYFTRLTRLLSKNDHQLFERLFELIYKTSTDDDGREGILWLFHQRASRDENIKLLAELQEEDLTAEELHEREQACFPPNRTVNSDAIAVARKLTLMSEMNPAFLADHRLWQWVEEARVQDELP